MYSIMSIFLVIYIFIISIVVTNSLSTLHPSCSDDERLALLHFKNTFSIDCDVSRPICAHPTTLSWTDGGPNDRDCCLWDGVSCDKDTGHVIGLDLSCSCLYGYFHDPNTTLFNLPYLEEINLSFNDFNNSPIFSGLGHRLSQLEILNLSFSAFSGQVPSDISKLSRLSVLDLSGNGNLQLKGDHLGFQRLVQNLTRLNRLSLDAVDISSPVPRFLANLTSLTSVSVVFCNLYGEFPTNIISLPHLTELDVHGNTNLYGHLPKFAHTSNLRRLSLMFTSFSGELPPSIGNLVHLEELSLVGSMFSGQLPSSLGNLTRLTVLELDGYYFTGVMPSSVTNLTQLRRLYLSNLNAPMLFPWLSKLNKKLLVLFLQDMNLRGEIPSILANFTIVQNLDFSSNQLTGRIPDWLMNLTHLQSLSLSDNQLEGTIPPTISQLESLDKLILDGNRNLHANFETLLNLKYLTELDLSTLTLTFHENITTNKSFTKFADLSLSSCSLKEFPPFLSTQDELQILELKDNEIHGVIPLWLVNVTRNKLVEFDLSLNSLTGFERPSKVLPWPNLEVLNLDGNNIQGVLPVPSNSILMYLVSKNSLTGNIPREFCKATSLNYLDLSFNNLGGRIPECISHLGSSLEILNLQGNTFHDTIPSEYPRSCKLKMINLSKNQLTGSLPRSLANCKMLEVLDIGDTKVDDTFPSWLGTLLNLQILVLRHNNFHGRVGKSDPSFSFRSLRIMDISHNFHTGDLPSEYLLRWKAMKVTNVAGSAVSQTMVTLMIMSPFGNYYFPDIYYDYTITIANKGNDMSYPKILVVLRIIDFSDNNFTGTIPDFIGQLKGLQAINLSNNHLKGGIPSSLANISDLQSLDLSNNQLSGSIPPQLMQLTHLEVCNVSNNLLVGPIPEGNQFNTFDNSSFDGNLGLCGGTLSKTCGKPENEPPTSTTSVTDNEKDESSNIIDWIIRCLGCVSGFALGGAIGKYMTDKNHDWFVKTFGRRNRRTKTKPRRRS